MLVKDCMTRDVEVVRPDASVEEAARKMKTLDIGALPVCDGDRIAGIVTDRDLTVRGSASGRIPAQARVKEVMTPGILYCFEDQDIRDAADLMADKQVRRLVVLNRDKRLAGIVSLGDLAVDTGDKHLAGRVLTEVSEPVHSKPVHSDQSAALACPACGMPRAGWPDSTQAFGIYCCRGCAEGTGCLWIERRGQGIG